MQGRIVVMSIILIALVGLGLFVAVMIKKWLQQGDPPMATGFTLSDLRRLHKSGQMSDEEFERARAKMIEAAQRAAQRDAERDAEREARRGTQRGATQKADSQGLGHREGPP